MSLIYAVLSFYFKMVDYWWKTSLCFAAGVWMAEYREMMDRLCLNHKITVLIISLMLLGGGYIYYLRTPATQLIPQLILFVCVCLSIVMLVKCIGLSNKLYSKIGTYSFEIYLIHIGLLSTIFSNENMFAYKCVIYLCISVVLSIVTHYVITKLNKIVFDKS